MVDAAASFDSNRLAGHSSTAATPQAERITVHTDPEAGLAGYEAAATNATSSPAQSPAWIKAWIIETKPDFVVAILSRDSQPRLAMALEVAWAAGFRVARFMGGSHANGNFPLLAADSGAITASNMRELASAIGRARPDIDMLSLERLEPDVAGRQNPLLTLSSQPSPNMALAVNLEGGFDALLERASGKRKRKKNRSQIRKFETAGGYRFVTASNEADVDRLLGAFFAMKEVRFRMMGVANVFEPTEVQAFFRRLFKDALGREMPDFVLDGLEVGGALRAVTGSSRCGDRLVCEFGAIAEDDMAYASPGEFLFFENIRRACAAGFSVYDFSVGDEPYKRLWCDVETVHHDVFMPLTAKGKLLAVAMRARSRLKARVKNSRQVWGLVKRLRRRRSEKAANSQDD